MYFINQKDYEHYYSPAQMKLRTDHARMASEKAVSEALKLFNANDTEAARHVLFEAGFQDDGIAYYLSAWSR